MAAMMHCNNKTKAEGALNGFMQLCLGRFPFFFFPPPYCILVVASWFFPLSLGERWGVRAGALLVGSYVRL